LFFEPPKQEQKETTSDQAQILILVANTTSGILGDYRWCVADSWLYCWLANKF